MAKRIPEQAWYTINDPKNFYVAMRDDVRKRPGLHTACCQHRPKRRAELRVTIVQNITASIQISPRSDGSTLPVAWRL
jgi:hypothetical protein